MILIQAAVPLACVFALLFAGWFLFDLRLRSSGSDAVQDAISASRRESARLFGRMAPFAGISVVVVVPATAALVGWGHESVKDAAYVAAAAGLGTLLALVVWMVSPAIAVLAAGRTAAALEEDNGISPTFAALWGGASITLMGGVVALAAPAALFGAYTAGIGVPIPLAPQLVAGFVAGVAAVAGGTRLVGAGYVHAMSGEVARPPSGAFLGLSATALNLIVLLSLAAVASSAPAGVLWMTTGAAAWMLLPTAVLAFGLFASTLAAMTLAFWTRLASPIGAARLGFWTVAVLSGAAAMAAPFAMPEGSIFFGLAGLAGVAGALLLVTLSPGRQSGLASAGWAATIVVAVVIGGAALGRDADIHGIAAELAALLGVSLAVAGFLMSAAYVAAVRGAAAVAADAAQISGAEELDAIDDFGGWAEERSGVYNTVALLLVAVLAGLAILSAARWEIGAAALDGPEEYLDLAAELHLVPDAVDLRAAQSFALADFVEDVEGLRTVLSDEEAAFMFTGSDSDVRLMALRKLAGEELSDDEAAALGGGPFPLPRLLPLDATALPVLAGLIGGLAVLSLALGSLARARRETAEGVSFSLIPALLALVLLLAIPAISITFRVVEGGAAGWQAAVGTVIGLALAASLVGRGEDRAVGGGGTAALMVIAILVAVAPVFAA